jgi:guanine deaminase
VTHEQIIRGPILNPLRGGGVQWISDGALRCDGNGAITFVGAWGELASSPIPHRQSDGIICPPFIDAHIHIPQWPIRGRFDDGVEANPPEGRLIASLTRNVFPAEARCADERWAEQVTHDFLADTLARGVVGGAAYMTVHARATEIALQILPRFWSVGMVLMNQNCPEYLRTDEANLDRDHQMLFKQFGQRFIPTDRFAVAVSSPLRQRTADFATRNGLRMQTHLNEQVSEKHFIENQLYPGRGTYTDVYAQDGLLDCRPILAHCIHMGGHEMKLVRDHNAVIAHCPTSNTLLGSGVMPLDLILEHGIEYAICTDVGASPTTSLLCEMAQFLKVHRGRHARATAVEALYRTTLGAARILGLDQELGTFAPGMPLSFIEIASNFGDGWPASADEAILRGLLESDPRIDDRDVQDTKRALDHKVQRVTIAGEEIWRKASP